MNLETFAKENPKNINVGTLISKHMLYCDGSKLYILINYTKFKLNKILVFEI